jgi:hypothetical protein
VLSNGHAGCGGRARETGRSKYRYRALARPYPVVDRVLAAIKQKTVSGARTAKIVISGLSASPLGTVR